MKFATDPAKLHAALAHAHRAAAPPTAYRPALSCLLLELSGDDLKIVGSDSDRRMTVRVAVKGKRDGLALIPSRLLCALVASMPDSEMLFDAPPDASQATLKCGNVVHQPRLHPAGAYPDPSDMDDAEGPVTVAATDLAAALKQVVVAASRDESRPILTGILIDGSADPPVVVATDSYRLARRRFDGAVWCKPGRRPLIPAKAAADVLRMCCGRWTRTTTPRPSRFGSPARRSGS